MLIKFLDKEAPRNVNTHLPGVTAFAFQNFLFHFVTTRLSIRYCTEAKIISSQVGASMWGRDSVYWFSSGETRETRPRQNPQDRLQNQEAAESLGDCSQALLLGLTPGARPSLIIITIKN